VAAGVAEVNIKNANTWSNLVRTGEGRKKRKGISTIAGDSVCDQKLLHSP
jgi:hypothetical protein